MEKGKAMRDKKIEKAIRLLESEYERALKLDYIRNPLAYALYQVWKKVEGKSDEANTHTYTKKAPSKNGISDMENL